MGFLSPKSSGPSASQLEEEERKRRMKEAMALRSYIASERSDVSRDSLKTKNPGLFIPGGTNG